MSQCSSISIVRERRGETSGVFLPRFFALIFFSFKERSIAIPATGFVSVRELRIRNEVQSETTGTLLAVCASNHIKEPPPALRLAGAGTCGVLPPASTRLNKPPTFVYILLYNVYKLYSLTFFSAHARNNAIARIAGPRSLLLPLGNCSSMKNGRHD